jgi:deferrochelatase/peroxidase EfeB
MTSDPAEPASGGPARVTRRRFLGTTVAAAGVGAAVAVGVTSAVGGGSPATGEDTVPFSGEHQAGIATPVQDRLAFAAFDLTTTSRGDLERLLRNWTSAARRMVVGRELGRGEPDPLAPPVDTGEALGLRPSRLTLTIGFGPTMFDDRFGLSARRPAALADLPPLPGERLDPERSGGDLCIQACADDPQVAFHAMRNLARLGRGTVVLRWSQLGFGRTSTTTSGTATPRNLMGFKDGTRNIRGDDRTALDRFVWVGDDTDQPWMRGGSYVVARRIRMFIEVWDRASLQDQQDTIGRFKVSGAPLSGGREHDTPRFGDRTSNGPAIPDDAHIRLASAEENHGVRILRRGYSFTDGIDTSRGELDAGLFFIAYQRDPRTQFVPLQRRLGAHDALSEYISHTGSGLFACPPGVGGPDDFWGRSLLGAV